MYEYEYSYILYRYSWERLIVAVLAPCASDRQQVQQHWDQWQKQKQTTGATSAVEVAVAAAAAAAGVGRFTAGVVAAVVDGNRATSAFPDKSIHK
jgi:hypothetical protein